MKKKIICAFLCVLMLANMAVIPAFATNEVDLQQRTHAQQLIFESVGSENCSKNLVNTVVQDLSMLETAHLNLFVSISEVLDDGTVVYEIPFEEANTTDYVTVSKNGSDVVVNFTEDDKHNVVIIKNEGRMFLDGYEITAETDRFFVVNNKETQESAEPCSIARVGMVHSSRTYSLPNGDRSIPSDFSVTNSSYATNRITFGTFLKDVSYGAIVATVSGAVVGGLKGIFSGLSTTGVGAAIDAALWYIKNSTVLMLQSHLDSDTMSFSAVKYVNKKNDTLHAEWLYSIKVYGAKNYGGSPTTVGVLECLDAT